MKLSFRRLYATMPDIAAAARTASTPRAVRLRRLRKRPAVPPGESDATKEGLTPTENARYLLLRAKGELEGEDGKTITKSEWLERLNARRSRMRGIKYVKTKSGAQDLEVVGQKIYLPNIIFRLVRNHTPVGQAYNPYEATFRIPQSVTKNDVRSYLAAVYGVKTTYIRTDNYISSLYRLSNSRSAPLRTKSHRTYKRAVVGLVDPFYYPLALEDMGEEERAERDKWIETNFHIEEFKKRKKYELLRLTKAGSKDWKWRGSLVLKRSAILKLVAERRAMREGIIEDYAKDMRAQRSPAVSSQSDFLAM
jgi:large subunit ribosomal protein L23